MSRLDNSEREQIVATINRGRLAGFMQEAMDDGYALAYTKGCKALGNPGAREGGASVLMKS
jgi:hypothetical protein